MTINEIEAQLNNNEISPDDQVWWNADTGDMIVVSDEAKMDDKWDWSFAGTVAEMVAA